MQTIWKYPLKLAGEQVVTTPIGARALCVQMQGDSLCLWVLCDPTAGVNVDRTIRIIGTGHPIEIDPGSYIGTIQIDGGALIFHVFDATIH